MSSPKKNKLNMPFQEVLFRLLTKSRQLGFPIFLSTINFSRMTLRSGRSYSVLLHK